MSRARIGPLAAVLAALLGSSLGAQVGSVLDQRKITSGLDGFAGVLHDDDYFGTAVAPLGDVNGDGVPDLAVAAYGDDTLGPNSGAVWLLFFGRDGRVSSQTPIHGTGFIYSQALTRVGDLDGDGIAELAVGTVSTHSADIYFLASSGAVRWKQSIRFTDPVFQPPIPGVHGSGFATALAGPGDVDADGVPDLVIGAPFDSDGVGGGNGALWIVCLRPDGSPKSATKISEEAGGGAGLIDTVFLGHRIVSLGDLDGDGHPELLVSDPPATHRDTQPTALLVLFLDGNRNLRAVTRIPQEEFGLVGDGHGNHLACDFGESFARLGDLDGDGTLEIAVGAPLWTPDVQLAQPVHVPGAVVIASLHPDGTLARSVLVARGRAGLTGDVPDASEFGSAVSAVGDLDRDGVPELAVGARLDIEAGDDCGAVWLLRMDGSAVRNGTGVNPIVLQQQAPPVLGAPWTLTLDCSGHAPGSALLWAFARPHSGYLIADGERLVDVTSTRFFRLLAPHSGASVSFPLVVPANPALFGLALSLQGLCTGAPAARLTNALDVIVGR